MYHCISKNSREAVYSGFLFARNPGGGGGGPRAGRLCRWRPRHWQQVRQLSAAGRKAVEGLWEAWTMWKYLEILRMSNISSCFYNVSCFIHRWSISLADFLCCSFDWNWIPLNTAKFATSGFLLQGLWRCRKSWRRSSSKTFALWCFPCTSAASAVSAVSAKCLVWPWPWRNPRVGVIEGINKHGGESPHGNHRGMMVFRSFFLFGVLD